MYFAPTANSLSRNFVEDENFLPEHGRMRSPSFLNTVTLCRFQYAKQLNGYLISRGSRFWLPTNAAFPNVFDFHLVTVIMMRRNKLRLLVCQISHPDRLNCFMMCNSGNSKSRTCTR